MTAQGSKFEESLGWKLSDQEFDWIRRLALSLAGIELSERHRQLLERRGRRFGADGHGGMASLLDAAENGEPTATQQLLRLLTTKFTGFFRHPRHFDVAVQHARQAVRQRGRARLWSAAAATGAEPFSLAIRLTEAFERDEPPASILASDIDADVLAVAQRGEYDEAVLADLEPTRRERFFGPTEDARRWSVVAEVRRLVEFHVVNLAGVTWPVDGPFDVIFCRNVLMYFHADYRYAVLESMASLLAQDGLLILDPTEHLGRASHWFTSGADGVYSLRRVAAPVRSRVAIRRTDNL